MKNLQIDLKEKQQCNKYEYRIVYMLLLKVLCKFLCFLSCILQIKVKVHTSQRPKRPELILVSLLQSINRSIATDTFTEYQSIIQGYPPPICHRYTIYTPEGRETKWRKVPCLRKQRDGRGLNPQPPDSEFMVLRWLNTVLAVCKYMSFAKLW